MRSLSDMSLTSIMSHHVGALMTYCITSSEEILPLPTNLSRGLTNDSMIGASETLATLGLNEDDVDVEYHEFTDMEITLEHHKVRNGDIKVNVCDCLNYLTEDADRAHIMERPFVKKCWEHILEMATAEETVDLFDKDTWGDHDYSPLRKAVLSEICIHSIHQQRCENYVQLAAPFRRQMSVK